MKKLISRVSLSVLGAAALFLTITAFTTDDAAVDYTANFVNGSVDFESIGQLSFGPQGILFFGDSRGANLFALETKDITPAADNKPLAVADIEEKIAQQMGAKARDINIIDMAINPISQNAYLSVIRGRGDDASYHLVSVSKDQSIEEVDLQNASYSQFALGTAPAADAKDRRGRSLRTNTITDIAFTDNSVYVAGLSNEEFASGFRQVQFPFNKRQESLTTLEIYHVAHEQYETHAPIRTFLPYNVNGKSNILAGYTCTPLVLFEVGDMKNGDHVKGKTVAELGFGNTPLDIITFKTRAGKDAIIIANSNRSAMLVDGADVASQDGLTTPLEGTRIASGTPYTPMPLGGVQQLDNLNSDYFALLRRMGDGSMRLYSFPKSRIAL